MAYQQGGFGGGYQQPPGGYGAPPAGQYGAPGGYGGQAPPPGPGGYGQPPGYPAPGGAPYGGGPPGCPPGINPQVWQWFSAIDSDASHRLTVNELQQALTNSNWSHFNPETCRLMIGMFDRDRTGTIELHEFQQLWDYITQWKGVFDRYDGDRSGFIEQNELMQAWGQMGYRLSPQFYQIVLMKFDFEGRRRLKFDQFIQASVMLKSLTDGFKARDRNMSGTIQVSYEDFMCMVMENSP